MGAQLVGVAMAKWWPHLGRYHASRCVLVYMAHTAKDTHECPAYWGGTEVLADALGLSGSARSRAKGVREALAPLREIGAITNLEKPTRGRRGKYQLNLRLDAVVVDAPANLRNSRPKGTVTGTPSETVTGS